MSGEHLRFPVSYCALILQFEQSPESRRSACELVLSRRNVSHLEQLKDAKKPKRFGTPAWVPAKCSDVDHLSNAVRKKIYDFRDSKKERW